MRLDPMVENAEDLTLLGRRRDEQAAAKGDTNPLDGAPRDALEHNRLLIDLDAERLERRASTCTANELVKLGETPLGWRVAPGCDRRNHLEHGLHTPSRGSRPRARPVLSGPRPSSVVTRRGGAPRLEQTGTGTVDVEGLRRGLRSRIPGVG